jgi:flagellin
VRKVLIKLGDDSLSTDERSQYNADYTSLRAEIDNYIAQAEFNGANLVNTAGGDVSIIFDINGGTFDLASQDIEADTADLADVADAAAATTLLAGDFATFESTVGSALATIGGYVRSVNNQQNFVSTLKDATDVGIGAIVDADLAKDSALLQSLQIRQQLGTQALSIANQGPSILLNLFR